MANLHAIMATHRADKEADRVWQVEADARVEAMMAAAPSGLAGGDVASSSNQPQVTQAIPPTQEAVPPPGAASRPHSGPPPPSRPGNPPPPAPLPYGATAPPAPHLVSLGLTPTSGAGRPHQGRVDSKVQRKGLDKDRDKEEERGTRRRRGRNGGKRDKRERKR